MTSKIRIIERESELATALTSVRGKLIVIDFYAVWCGPCKRIGPVFEEMASKYEQAVFVKADVEKCQETATLQGITCLPTFVFFKNGRKLDEIQGADANKLEEKIKQHYNLDESTSDPEGFVDLLTYLNKNECEALNESDDHPLSGCLDNSETYLESGHDEQLIISLTFIQPVKIHSIKIKAPKDAGPKNIKLFINRPNTLDFAEINNIKHVQEFSLQPEHLDDEPILLKYVLFQSVQNIQIFVKDNQSNMEKTAIQCLQLFGLPISSTNIKNLKKL